MSGISDFFLDGYTFVVSQFGLVFLGFLIGRMWGAGIDKRGDDLIDEDE